MRNPLSAIPTKWSNLLVYVSRFDHFEGLALKGLYISSIISVLVSKELNVLRLELLIHWVVRALMFGKAWYYLGK